MNAIQVWTAIGGGGLAVAAITGLFWLAYRHPRSFQKLSNAIQICMAVGFLAFIAYSFGYSAGVQQLRKFATAGGDVLAFEAYPFGLMPALIVAAVSMALTAMQSLHKLKDD